MANYTLETENVTASYDPQTGLLFVTYRGVMTPDVTVAFYRWLGDLIKTASPDDLMKARGSIYDFRQVKQFAASNISTAQRQSQQVNHAADMSHIPVALITESLLQTEWVRVTMKIMPDQDRKRVVKSMEEAVAFIDQFHARRAPEPPAENVSAVEAPNEASSTSADVNSQPNPD
jgi:hypothetical protein